MEKRKYGNTGLEVSALGLGGGRIGDASEAEANRILGAALDLGITLIDTARSYGDSEARIGRFLSSSGRRARVVLSTKVGYGVEGVPDWTAPCIERGIDDALVRLQTEFIDVVHLHSCPLETLEQGEVVDAVARAVSAGKIRVAAYSGDGAPLFQAAGDSRFGAIQCSINLCDQGAITAILPGAAARGLGVIAKRPLANAPWSYRVQPEADDVAEYWRRWNTLALDTGGLPPDELALRFALSVPGVSSCIVGTRDTKRLARNVEIARKGPLPGELIRSVTAAFAARGPWPGLV